MIIQDVKGREIFATALIHDEVHDQRRAHCVLDGDVMRWVYGDNEECVDVGVEAPFSSSGVFTAIGRLVAAYPREFELVALWKV